MSMWVTSHNMDRLRNCYFHFVEARKAAWALNRCMTTRSADYCMHVNEWAWSKSQICLLRLEVDVGLVVEPELKQKWR